MEIARRNLLNRSILAVGLALLLPFAGCGNGSNNNDIIVAPFIHASYDTACAADCAGQGNPKVFLDNITTAGDVLNADVMLEDTSGTLDVDDIDLVLRYDATFMQVATLRPETLFGNCGSLNPACQVLSPVCVNNQSAANAGGERYCRSNGTTLCLHDTDCPSPGDVCGDFGRLQASFAVLTGPKTCSNNTSRSCTQNSDCQFCTSNVSQACLNTAGCSGTCTSFVCVGGSFNGRSCNSSVDCVDTCGSGLCTGCPSVIVNQKARIVNLTLRVIGTGTSELRFVVSSNPSDTASAVRKDTFNVVPAVSFCASVNATDPSMIQGCFRVTGTK